MNMQEYNLIASIIYGNNELIEKFSDALEQYKSFDRTKFMIAAGYTVNN
jgi:hypothetical protein